MLYNFNLILPSMPPSIPSIPSSIQPTIILSLAPHHALTPPSPAASPHHFPPLRCSLKYHSEVPKVPHYLTPPRYLTMPLHIFVHYLTIAPSIIHYPTTQPILIRQPCLIIWLHTTIPSPPLHLLIHSRATPMYPISIIIVLVALRHTPPIPTIKNTDRIHHSFETMILIETLTPNLPPRPITTWNAPRTTQTNITTPILITPTHPHYSDATTTPHTYPTKTTIRMMLHTTTQLILMMTTTMKNIFLHQLIVVLPPRIVLQYSVQ